jgi:hypothetical protein
MMMHLDDHFMMMMMFIGTESLVTSSYTRGPERTQTGQYDPFTFGWGVLFPVSLPSVRVVPVILSLT